MLLISSIYAYQIVMLVKTVSKIEKLNNNMEAFISEKRKVIGQFVTFALAFFLKTTFNISLTIGEEGNDLEKWVIPWCILFMLWSGGPITYTFVQNWYSFRESYSVQLAGSQSTEKRGSFETSKIALLTTNAVYREGSDFDEDVSESEVDSEEDFVGGLLTSPHAS